MPPQRLNPEEVFEDRYTDAFTSRFNGRGIEVAYVRDRAARDVGFHLVAPGTMELSNVRVWFQLKGKHKETIDTKALDLISEISISVDVDDVKKWYAAPEAVYLVVYLEALDEFVGEDIRDIVDRAFAGHRSTPGAILAAKTAETMTLKVNKDAKVDDYRILSMLQHRSMRIDGPTWRGTSLGHRYDPLRCELGVQDPVVFVELVERLLTLHDYRIEQRLDASQLLKGVAEGTDQAFLSVGTMLSMYEWPFSLGVEIGYSLDTPVRSEGQMLSVYGKTAVFVHSRFGGHAERTSETATILQLIRDSGVDEVLAIGNASEPLLLASYRGLFGDLIEFPQGGAGLAYSVLTSPLVLMEFAERLNWMFVNYVWDDPDRPPVQLAPPERK
jgi:hypothetical protein